MARWSPGWSAAVMSGHQYAAEPPLRPAADQLLTVSQAADLLAVSESTLRRLLRSGRLRHVRLGRMIRVPAAEVANAARYGTHHVDRPEMTGANGTPSTQRR